MLLCLPLFSTLLLTPVVLARHSRFRSHIARRNYSFQSQVNNRQDHQTKGDEFKTYYSQNWAGAFWQQANNTFNSIEGTFTVPKITGSNGSGAAVWVGIDGDTCLSAILQTGIAGMITDGQTTYFAWYEWYPAPSASFNLPIQPEDTLTLSVTAFNSTSGMTMIRNVNTGQVVSEYLTSSAPLCGQDAEWIVEDFQLGSNGTEVPFANFSTVQFTNTRAHGPMVDHTAAGADLLDMTKNKTIVTDVSISRDGTVTIKHL